MGEVTAYCGWKQILMAYPIIIPSIIYSVSQLPIVFLHGEGFLPSTACQNMEIP